MQVGELDVALLGGIANAVYHEVAVEKHIPIGYTELVNDNRDNRMLIYYCVDEIPNRPAVKEAIDKELTISGWK